MAWKDPPTEEQEKTIGRFARILGLDVEDFYPIADRREAQQIQYELLKLVRVQTRQRAAERISRKIVDA